MTGEQEWQHVVEMNLEELNAAAERHPWRWAMGAGVALGSLFGILARSLTWGVTFALSTFVIQLVGTAVRRRIRRR